MKRIYEWFGGRKQFNTYLALVIALGAAGFQDPGFLAFMGVVGGILGLGSLSIAYEDGSR